MFYSSFFKMKDHLWMKVVFLSLRKVIRGMQSKFILRKNVSKTGSCPVRNSSSRGAVCVSYVLILPHGCCELCLWGRKTHCSARCEDGAAQQTQLCFLRPVYIIKNETETSDLQLPEGTIVEKGTHTPQNTKTNKPNCQQKPKPQHPSLPRFLEKKNQNQEQQTTLSLKYIIYLKKENKQTNKHTKNNNNKQKIVRTGWLFSNPSTRKITTSFTKLSNTVILQRTVQSEF